MTEYSIEYHINITVMSAVNAMTGVFFICFLLKTQVLGLLNQMKT